MSEFAKSNRELDAAIAKCNSAEEIRELSKASLAAQGIISRNVREDGNYGARVVPGREPVATSLPATPAVSPTHSRVVYPSGNNRFELYGSSEAELDEKENQIRQMFGGQR